MSVIDEIKAKLDIVAYIQQTVPLKKAGRYYKAHCPFHHERTPSFIVNPDTQSWRCFGACAEGGDIFGFAMKQHGWSFTEALHELGRLAGVEVRPRTPEQKGRDEKLDRLRGLLQSAADFYHQHLLNTSDPDAVATLDYVRDQRGLNDETVARFQIGYAPAGWQDTLSYLKQLGYSEDEIVEVGLARRSDSGHVYDYFRHRLMIPIRDGRGRIIGFGARALAADDNPKYLNSPQTPLFDKSRVLFGLDMAGPAIRDTETVVIVEGYLDAIQAHQAGFTNVVAQMGTAMTEAQLKQVARWARRIILALDADAAGQNATRRSLEVARGALRADYTGRLAVDIRILQLPDAKDPDDLICETPERWDELVASAIPVADFVIDMEVATLPAKASLQEREAVARRLLPILVASENNLYRKENIQKLALRLRIAERDLLVWAQEQGRILAAKAPRRSSPPTETRQASSEPEPEDSKAPVPVYTPLSHDGMAIETYCLRVLFRNPHLIYQVNRKFRELAGEDRSLLRGPLSDLGEEDFQHSQHRVLMGAFKSALAQDDMEPLDYLLAHLDTESLHALNVILIDDADAVRNHVRNRLYAELSDCWKHHERKRIASLDWSAELIMEALRLRIRRLQRVYQEVCFLQMDPEAGGDDMAEQASQIMLFNRAKWLLEAEVQRQLSLYRE